MLDIQPGLEIIIYERGDDLGGIISYLLFLRKLALLGSVQPDRNSERAGRHTALLYLLEGTTYHTYIQVITSIMSKESGEIDQYLCLHMYVLC